MGKVVPLEELKTKEEYESAVQRRNNIGKRIAWLNDDRIDHKAVIERSIALLRKRENDNPRDIGEQVAILEDVLGKIQNGQYKGELQNAFEAYSAQVKQFEYRQKSETVINVIRKAFKGELNLSEYIAEQNFIRRINRYGLVSMPNEQLGRQTPEEVLQGIVDTHELVGIKNEPLSLIPVNEEMSFSSGRDRVAERLKGITNEAYRQSVSVELDNNVQKPNKSHNEDTRRLDTRGNNKSRTREKEEEKGVGE